jgi:hypothetical protein
MYVTKINKSTIETESSAPVNPAFLLGSYNEVFLFPLLKHL